MPEKTATRRKPRAMPEDPYPVQIWRAQLGLTQAEAAQALGLGERHYQRLESVRVLPDRRTALAMAAVAKKLLPWEPPETDQG